MSVSRAWRTFEPIVHAVPESYKGDAISRPVNEEQYTFVEIEHQDQLTRAIQGAAGNGALRLNEF
jgi:hypothetical protein